MWESEIALILGQFSTEPLQILRLNLKNKATGVPAIIALVYSPGNPACYPVNMNGGTFWTDFYLRHSQLLITC